MTKEQFRAWCESVCESFEEATDDGVESYCRQIGEHDKEAEALLRKLCKAQFALCSRCAELK